MGAGSIILGIVAALGQAQGGAEGVAAAWLKSVPAEAPIVLRVRGVEPLRRDLVAMVQKMAPAEADQARLILNESLKTLTADLGVSQGSFDQNAPILVVARLPDPDHEAPPPGFPLALIARTDDYAAFRRFLAAGGSDAPPEERSGGYEAVTTPDGATMFSARGQGFAVMCNEESLIQSIIQPPKALDSALGDGLKAQLLGGDLGVYLDLTAVRARYGDQINRTRQATRDLAETIEGSATGPTLRQLLLTLDAGLDDSLNDTRALGLSLDFAADGLVVDGLVTVDPNSPSAQKLAQASTVPGQGPRRLPAGLTYYLEASLDPAAFDRMMALKKPFLKAPGGAPSPEVQKALDRLRAAGARDLVAAFEMAPGGPRSVSETTYAQPAEAFAALTDLLRALPTNQTQAANGIRSLAIQPRAQTYHDLTLNRLRITWDLEALARRQPNLPQGAETLNDLIGPDLTVWYGVQGQSLLTVTAPDWNQARELLDARNGLDRQENFRTLRDRLPDQVSGLLVISAQGLIRQAAAQAAAIFPDQPAREVPADLPQKPAYLGGSITARPDGFHFRTVVPSPAGPVFEKGMIPVFQDLAGNRNAN